MRHLLLGLITIGAVTTGVGLTGVIAPATDDARTGTVTKEYAETGQFPPQVDLQLAPWDETTNDCGAFTDNLQTGVFAVNTGRERTFETTRTICVRNRGTQAKVLNIVAEDPVLTDPVCTPDETYVAGGELVSGCNGADAESFQVLWWMLRDPTKGAPTCPDFVRVAVNEPRYGVIWHQRGQPSPQLTVAPLPANGVACVYQMVASSGSPSNNSILLPDSAQTDRLEWRFRFSS